MYKNRKHLVRCNTSVEKKVVTDGKEEWKSDGFVELETKLDIDFIIGVEEEILNKAFEEMVKKHNTDDLRYVYIDFELVYHFPIKLKGNPVKTYQNEYRKQKEIFKQKLYE